MAQALSAVPVARVAPAELAVTVAVRALPEVLEPQAAPPVASAAVAVARAAPEALAESGFLLRPVPEPPTSPPAPALCQ